MITKVAMVLPLVEFIYTGLNKKNHQIAAVCCATATPQYLICIAWLEGNPYYYYYVREASLTASLRTSLRQGCVLSVLLYGFPVT